MTSEVTVTGKLEHITFHNPETLYTVARLKPVSMEQNITIVGIFPKVLPGETVEAEGIWHQHATYGAQIKVHRLQIITPTSLEDIRTYLCSGLITGLGPKTALRIIDYFQEETIEILDRFPFRLGEVKGIGKRMTKTIAEAWAAHHTTRKLGETLAQAGVRMSMVSKIEKAYGNMALEILRENPYTLAMEFPQGGFQAADALARFWDVAEDTPARAAACIGYVLQEQISRGHTYTSFSEVQKECVEKFELSEHTWEDGLHQLISQGLVVQEDGLVEKEPVLFSEALYEAETGVARRLLTLAAAPLSFAEEKTDSIVEKILQTSAIALTQEQLCALEGVLKDRVSVIAGGPGTGKTTLIKSLFQLFSDEGKTVRLCAPTGRAARRLYEVTGQEAETIHKMLGYSPTEGVFNTDEKDPLEADVIIVDEMSMVDVVLMCQLMRAIPITARLILVGDVFQLPPVGPGNALGDILHSGKIPVYFLTEIHRQHERSLIIPNAHRIRTGIMPEFCNDEESEFYFFERLNLQSIATTVVKLCTELIPRHFDAHPLQDIQVLTPMHKGAVGTIQLNQMLQEVLNPATEDTPVSNLRFRLRDKVMHLKNNYQKEVFNGDIGMVKEINPAEKIFWVEYQDRVVQYEFAEQDEITLAYVVSVHKSQGSEYPVVILPLTSQHAPLLQRNLLYTAVTRAKKAIVLVGSPRALKMAVDNDRPDFRRSALRLFLERQGATT